MLTELDDYCDPPFVADGPPPSEPWSDQEFIELLIDENCRLQEAMRSLIYHCIEHLPGPSEELNEAYELLLSLEQ
jgi:hypothetical protein